MHCISWKKNEKQNQFMPQAKFRAKITPTPPSPPKLFFVSVHFLSEDTLERCIAQIISWTCCVSTRSSLSSISESNKATFSVTQGTTRLASEENTGMLVSITFLQPR